MNDNNNFNFVMSTIILFLIGCFGAWVTHVINCLQDDRWGFLIAGAMAAPVAVVHGIGIWFGVW